MPYFLIQRSRVVVGEREIPDAMLRCLYLNHSGEISTVIGWSNEVSYKIENDRITVFTGKEGDQPSLVYVSTSLLSCEDETTLYDLLKAGLESFTFNPAIRLELTDMMQLIWVYPEGKTTEVIEWHAKMPKTFEISMLLD